MLRPRNGTKAQREFAVAGGLASYGTKGGVDALYRLTGRSSYPGRPTRIGIPFAGRSVTHSFGSGT